MFATIAGLADRRFQRTAVPSALAVLVSACAALPPAANYVGNTLYVVREHGAAPHYIYYQADGSCDIVFATTRYTCTYAVKGRQICLTAVRQGDDVATTHCHPFERGRRAGDEWDGIEDGRVHYRLVAGQNGHLDDVAP